MAKPNYTNEVMELLRTSKAEFIRAIKRLKGYRDLIVKQDPTEAQIERIRLNVDTAKAKLEKRLKKKFNKWQSKAINSFLAQMRSGRVVVILSKDLKDELTVLLVNHWYDTAETFVGRLSFERVKQIQEIAPGEPGQEEADNNEELLLPLLVEDIEKQIRATVNQQTPIHTRQISETTEQIGTQAIRMSGEEGGADIFEVDAIMRSKMAARTPAVTTTETEWIAETSERIALDVTTPVMATATESQLEELQDVSPNARLRTTDLEALFAIGTANEIDLFRRQLTNPQKMWVTMGDNRVRRTHQVVDGVTLPVNQPFQLAGGRMQFPADSSLGASFSEIAGCRCHAVYF